TVRLYGAAPSPKRLWLVEGADHEDLYAFAPEEYRRRVGEFIKTYLPIEEQ
ncbi:MAG: alpha/beta hydrolase, partial [Calditrichaeota bacterium]